jgi:Flp pilus assembly protein TadD
VAEELPERIRADRAAAFAPPSKNRCAEALALTGWDRYRMAIALSTLTGRPPFVNQVDYASQRRRLAQEIAILRRETTPDGIQRALQAYLDALESQPRDLYLLRNMGLLQQARGDFAAAATCWRRILMQIPRHAETRVSLGACLLATGAADEARRQFNEGLKATSNPVEIRRQTGLAFARAGRWADATAEYRSALALEPGHVQLRLMLAEALMHQGKAADGLREMEDAARARPTDPEIKFRLGALRLEQGRLDEAVDLLSEAVGLDPAIEPARDLLERAVRMRQNGHAN